MNLGECDRGGCPANAEVRVRGKAGELAFCTHDYRERAYALLCAGYAPPDWPEPTPPPVTAGTLAARKWGP